jgi:hypothetical protein
VFIPCIRSETPVCLSAYAPNQYVAFSFGFRTQRQNSSKFTFRNSSQLWRAVIILSCWVLSIERWVPQSLLPDLTKFDSKNMIVPRPNPHDIFYDFRRNDYMDILLVRLPRSRSFIPSASPWPFLTAQNTFIFLFCLVFYFHYFLHSVGMLIGSAMSLSLIISFWFKDIIFEAQYMGVYTLQNNIELRLGFALFLLSEVMFFFSFF